ncbi:MAG: alpha/beta fold hydrolase [Halobacteriovoraceae bacterium]|jgi:3-oxoadipate enol-lactonase|nr:alpha/beta fold hydrolase [Halobacteriovoraceae bacterium]
MKLHYQINNSHESTKPWLVLINGLFANLDSWSNTVGDLEDHFRVLCYDCRGQGKSPKPPGPYLLEEHVDDLFELLRDLKIDKCFIIGISNGGRIAMLFSKKFPAMVLAQVLADTYSHISELMKLKLLSWKEANKIGGPMLRFSVATPWIWGESFIEDKPELIEYYRKRASIEKTDVVNALIDGALESDIDLESECTPTLMLAGEEDLLTPVSTHQEMIKNYQQGKYLTIKGGHASLLEYPQTFKQIVIPYIKEYL